MSYSPFDVPSDPAGAVTDVSRPLLHRMNQARISASTLEGIKNLITWAYGELNSLEAEFAANQLGFDLPSGERATELPQVEFSPVSQGLRIGLTPEVDSAPANAVPETLADKTVNPSAGNVPGAPIPKDWEGDNADAPEAPKEVVEAPVEESSEAADKPAAEVAPVKEEAKPAEKPAVAPKAVVKPAARAAAKPAAPKASA